MSRVDSADGQSRTEPAISRPFLRSLPFIAVFPSEIFFSISTILGSSYSGSDESPVYVLFLGMVAVISVAISLWQILEKKVLPLRNLLVLCIPLIVVIVFLIDHAIGRTEPQSLRFLFYWCALGVPALIYGVSQGQARDFRSVSLTLEPIMIVMSLAVIRYAVENLDGIQKYGLGGATYQTASYIAAIAFSLNLYHLLNGPSHIRWRLLKTRAYFILSVVLVPIQISSCLMSGGRGGFVLLTVASGIIVWTAVKRSERRIWGKLVALATVSIGGAVTLMPILLADERTAKIIERVFAYVGQDGIDWSGTSGRDTVYQDTWQSIKESPQFGYGLFSWNAPLYPHNLFLEWLLNGGMLYVLFWLVVIGYMWIVYQRRVQHSAAALVLTPLALFPIVMLMFSGTYWASSSFWFIVGCLLSAPLNTPGNTAPNLGKVSAVLKSVGTEE